MNRFDRSTRFFGQEGLARLQATRVAIVGIGGLGTHAVQQTALLGVRDFAVIDDQTLTDTDLNRYIGVRPDDVGTSKVVLAERLIRGIDPLARVQRVESALAHAGAFAAIVNSDVIFGCLDNEGARLILVELCAAYGKPLFDLATDVEMEDRTRFGGRVVSVVNGNGCPVCLGELDLQAAGEDLSSPDQRRQREELYGVRHADLGRIGPAVVSINGVIASLGVTEFMVHVTGIRKPFAVLTYRGDLGVVLVRKEPAPLDCYYCNGIWNKRELAGVERYLD